MGTLKLKTSPTVQPAKGAALSNNNPLNIEKGIGNIPGVLATTGRFAKFASWAYGYRAAIKLLSAYYYEFHLKTVRQIVEKWCPVKENGRDKVDAYIQFVSTSCGITPDTDVDFSQKENIFAVVSAMSKHECGKLPTLNELSDAWKLSVDGKRR